MFFALEVVGGRFIMTENGEPKGAGSTSAGGRDLSTEERAHFRRRLSELDGKLDKVRAEQRGKAPRRDGAGKGLGYALRMAIDMVAAVFVGGAIGWFLDRWLGTAPVLILLVGALGVAAGFMNVARTYKQMVAETSGDIGHDLKTDAYDDED